MSSTRIETVFDAGVGGIVFNHPIQNILRKILPHGFFFQEPERFLAELNAQLPLVKWMIWETNAVSVFLLCPERAEVGKFFYDMISRWLLPGQQLNIGLFFSTNFKFPELSDSSYSLSKIVVSFDKDQDMELVKNNLEIIENEIRLGVNSAFHASRILEIKGLSINQKTSLIQERISTLVNKRPDVFDYDIFGHMQQFLVGCKEEFKEIREYEHLTRIIYVLYLFQKALQMQGEQFPLARHLSLKLCRTRLNLPFGSKVTLAVFVGVNFLKENEIFEEKHLLKALSNHIPDIQMVDDSLFTNHDRENKSQTLYLEVEKGSDFSSEEIARLRRVLPTELKNSIEQLVRPIFMPRNEEEVMRNILTLSNQLKYIRDIPQMIISFDEQTDKELSFTVVLLRILFPDSSSVGDLFHKSKTFLKFIPDRVKKVGLLRKKHIKEATVFRVRLPNTGFLREDHSVDLYKVRLHVVTELQRILGEVRDYNGGMISKQIELLSNLKNILGEVASKHEFLLENFYHSITPVEMRTVVNPHLLKTLFLMLLKPESHAFAQENNHYYFMIKTEKEELVAKIFEAIEEIRPSKLITTHFKVFETTYLGFISSDELVFRFFLL